MQFEFCAFLSTKKKKLREEIECNAVKAMNDHSINGAIFFFHYLCLFKNAPCALETNNILLCFQLRFLSEWTNVNEETKNQ